MPRRARTLPNRWALANNAGVNGKRAGPALPSNGRVARVPFRDQGSFAMERLAPGQATNANHWIRPAFAVRAFTVSRGSRPVSAIRPSCAWRSGWPASPMVTFSNLRFFNWKCENSRAEPNVISS
jgi:hypothetical protein